MRGTMLPILSSNFPSYVYQWKCNEQNGCKIGDKIGGTFGMTFGIDVFGKSAPYKDIYKYFGLISSNIVGKLKKEIKN